ncbi:nuclear transport factor 2 family protein [Massilia niastensis]|uniref:nuclear transport factor 2 family protein n=1 Tax=Massilia niastensis TaxID=544911 RepID=UPI000364CEFF|nr:nuclear transport factor 2 family protein [Massilia niastensis]
MDAQQNKQLVQEGYRLFQSGDIAGLLERYHDDAEWIIPESEYVPFSGSFHGKAGIAEFFSKLASSVETQRFELKECIAEGDKVVALGEAAWVARPTGRSYETPWAHVFTMRDGKVARFEAFSDTGATVKAFRPDMGAQIPIGSQLHH